MGRHRAFDESDALDAAMGAFWQKGYEGTSFEDLTKATGLARPSLYAAFGNKQSLFLKVVDVYEQTHLAFMVTALDEPTSYKVAETLLKKSVAVYTKSPVHPGCLGMNGALACSDDGETVRLDLARRRAANERLLVRRLERARSEADLPGFVDCKALAASLMASLQGMAVQAKSGASRRALDAVARQVLSTWPGAQGK